MTSDSVTPNSLATEIRRIQVRLREIETRRISAGSAVGGSDGWLLYNDAGTIGGAAGLHYQDTTGNLGIGGSVTNPIEKLHVDGDMYLEDGGSFWIGNNADSGGRFRLHHSTNGNAYFDYYDTLYFRSGSTSSATRVEFSSAGDVSIYGNLVLNDTTPILTLTGSDSSYAEIRAHGTSQGTGVAYVGQSSTYGGGMFYNGDGSPGYATGEAADRISFFRRNNGGNEVVFSYPYNSNTVSFRATPDVNGTSVSLSNHTHSYAASNHTHSYAATNHTHSYASTSSAVRALYYNGYGNSEITAYQTSGNWQTWTGGWATHIIGNHGNGSNYYNQTLVMPFWGGPYYMRKQGGGNVGPYLVYTSEHVNKSSADWTIGRAYVHNEVFVYNMDTTWSYNTVRYNTSNSQLMAYASLREMKTDVTEIQPLLDYLGERSLLYDLRPVIFRESDDRIGKDGEPLKTTRGEFAPGFIAEEIHEVAPELTYFDHKGDLISYSNDALIPHIVAELQRLAPMVESLYGNTHPDYVAPAPRPADRGEIEKAIYDLAAAEKAEHPTEFLDRPDEEMPPSFDLPDPPEEEPS